MFCLEEAAGLARVVKAMLPEGFSSDSVELTVSGRCGQCASAVAGTPPLLPPPDVAPGEIEAHAHPHP
jgi:hypothetical protein